MIQSYWLKVDLEFIKVLMVAARIFSLVGRVDLNGPDIVISLFRSLISCSLVVNDTVDADIRLFTLVDSCFFS